MVIMGSDVARVVVTSACTVSYLATLASQSAKPLLSRYTWRNCARNPIERNNSLHSKTTGTNLRCGLYWRVIKFMTMLESPNTSN